VRAANAHRDQAGWADAASLYLQGHALMPWRSDLLVQAGNCRKEAGDLAEAVKLYRRAADDPRQSPEAGKQIRDVDRRAARLWEQDGYGHHPCPTVDGPPFGPAQEIDAASFIAGQIAVIPNQYVRRLGELSRVPSATRQHMDPTNGRPLSYSAQLAILQIGNFRLDRDDGRQPLLTGVVALRVKVVSYAEAQAIRISLDAETIVDDTLRLVQRYSDGRYLSIANIWIDSGLYREGRRTLRVEAVLEDGSTLSRTYLVTLAAMPPTFALSGSDSFVPSPTTTYTDIATEVGDRAAIVRNTGDMVTADAVTSVLAIRIDQLGDLSSSLPALRRLREIYPQAHLTALVASSLSDIVVASGLVDEVIGLTTSYDPATEQRHLDDAQARKLYETLDGRLFDIAVDLSPNRESRRLLLLVGARCRVGFYPQDFPFLDFGVDIASRDKANNHSTQSHASLVLSLVELLHLKTRPLLPPVRRSVEGHGVLEQYGLRSGRYIVVHCGARHAINRWPQEKFWQLARALHERTGLRIVMFPDEQHGNGPHPYGMEDGIVALGNVSMDTFDVIMANAHAMIGNDSGPKHLAAVRGTWTTSIHINRLNWREWGQNGPGLIISKKTPCGGCGLNDPRLCGRDVACLRTITVEEVFDAVVANMPMVAAGPAT